MLVVARRSQDWGTIATIAAHYEFWTWEYGQAFQMFFGDLELDGPDGDEFLNIVETGSGQYLEMGYGDGAQRWYMGLSADGVFGRVEVSSDAGEPTRRIPVARGDKALLANSKAFVAYVAEKAGLLAQSDPASVFDLVSYVGDPGRCAMGANRARAYADSIAADFQPGVDANDYVMLQTTLVDAGDDGYPLLVKVQANPGYLIDDAGTHFISDAMLCHYRDGSVKEYPFIEEMGLTGDLQMMSVGLISAEQRHESVPVLYVELNGRYLGGDQWAKAEGFYFSDQGNVKLFHKLITVDGSNGEEYYWDGEACGDPDAELRAAGLDYDGYPQNFFAKNFADQNAGPGTAADIMEAMLRAYADSGVPDEKIVSDPVADDPGVIYYSRDGSRIPVSLGTSLAGLISGKVATSYHPHLAYALMVLAAAAYNEADITDSLHNLGLFEIDQRNYYDDPFDKRYGANSVGFSVAEGKTVDGRRLIFVPIRGTYGKIETLSPDWKSDFNLGEAFAVNTWHTGFSIASQEVFDAISHGEKTVDTEAVYVICGHSRGGAVGNQLAVRLQRAGVPSANVFCYNFACPDVARGTVIDWNNLGAHNNIWNIGRPADPVSMIPGVVGDLLRAGALGIATSGILSIPSNPLSAWGKFGRSYWYAPDWSKTADIVPDLTFSAHETWRYIEELAKEPPLDDMRQWAEMVAKLPIDAYIDTYRDLAELIDQYMQ